MIKTTYQTPELRNANDEIVQEGAFGKNTALSNATNDGWIDYVVNNLEALHDTIGDSAAHLDGNGHVVEPANLAIGDEDGNRLKTSYLKLSGGTMTGALNARLNLKMQDSQENVIGGLIVPDSSASNQFMRMYGGSAHDAGGAQLTLKQEGDGRFFLTAKSTDGSQTYDLRGDNNGSLYWRGYELAWKKDYLPISGGTATGTTTFNARTKFKSSIDLFEGDTEHGRIYVISNVLRITGGTNTSDGSYIDLSYTGGGTQQFRVIANDGTTQKLLVGKPDGTLTWDGKNIARDVKTGTANGTISVNGSDVSVKGLGSAAYSNTSAFAPAGSYLSTSGGTMTGQINMSNKSINFGVDSSANGRVYTINDRLRLTGGSNTSNGSWVDIGSSSAVNGIFLNASNGNGTTVELKALYDGTLTWGGKNLKPNLVKLYESATGASAGDTVSLEKIATDFATFIVMVCDDLTDGAGSAFGIFCTRMKGSGEGSQFGSNTIRGGNMLNYSASAVDMRMISIGISLNNTGTEATISNCSMVRINGTTNTFYARKIYAIYGMHLKSTLE